MLVKHRGFRGFLSFLLCLPSEEAGGVHGVGRGHSKDSRQQVPRDIPDCKMSRSAIKAGGKKEEGRGNVWGYGVRFPKYYVMKLSLKLLEIRLLMGSSK